MKTLILGASDNPERYAYLVMKTLAEKNLDFILVNPRLRQIDGHPCLASLEEVNEPVDTITVYLNPTHQAPLLPRMARLRPRRVIFNPGSESPASQQYLMAQGIKVLEACSLVLLKTGQY